MYSGLFIKILELFRLFQKYFMIVFVKFNLRWNYFRYSSIFLLFLLNIYFSLPSMAYSIKYSSFIETHLIDLFVWNFPNIGNEFLVILFVWTPPVNFSWRSLLIDTHVEMNAKFMNKLIVVANQTLFSSFLQMDPCPSVSSWPICLLIFRE